MIITTLPYPIELFEKIQNDGAIVDVSKSNFDDIDQSEKNRIILIYLRNTNFNNIQLDFSKCNINDKYELLFLYITDSIECYNSIFKTTWLKILSIYNNLKTIDYESLLTDNEILQFIEKYKNLINTLSEFYYSVPLFLLSRLNNLQLTEYEQIIDTNPININCLKLIEDKFLVEITSVQNKYKRTFYSKIFTVENTILFEILAKTIYGFILTLSTDIDKIYK